MSRIFLKGRLYSASACPQCLAVDPSLTHSPQFLQGRWPLPPLQPTGIERKRKRERGTKKERGREKEGVGLNERIATPMTPSCLPLNAYQGRRRAFTHAVAAVCEVVWACLRCSQQKPAQTQRLTVPQLLWPHANNSSKSQARLRGIFDSENASIAVFLDVWKKKITLHFPLRQIGATCITLAPQVV